jgi:uncharacterized protein with von Willebrand factor type A (vWA) domain
MRTVSTPINKDEKKVLKEIAESAKLKDTLKNHFDIVEDIFGFMKKPELIDEGDITEDLIKDFIKGEFEYYLPAKRKVQGRIAFFNRVLTHPYYAKFRELDPIKGSSILLEMLNAFYKDKQKDEEKGQSGDEEKDEAMREFEGIIRYGKELFDLLDDEWFKNMMKDQQMPGGGGKGFDQKPENLPQVVSQLVEAYGKQLKIYELSQKLEFTIRTSPKGKFNEVAYPDNGLDVDRIRKTRDVTKLLPSQLALDETLFMKKLVSKELLKKRYMQRQEKRQILYMIVDSSGSMDEGVGDGLTKIDVSKAVTIALMKKMISHEDLFFFRWFTDGVSDLHTIRTKEDAMSFLPRLVFGQHADGGTNIQHAIEVAAKDIKKKELAKIDLADILLVSDGLADVEVESSNKTLENIDMHTVLITRNKYDKNDQYQSKLIQISKNFLMSKCDEHSDVVEIANIFSK